jgi:bacteriocin biosynthesis cyclodehydratase domain-containing protein
VTFLDNAVCLSTDTYGTKVNDYLRQRHPSIKNYSITRTADLQSRALRADLVSCPAILLSSGRPAPRLAKNAASLAREHEIAFIPTLPDGPFLRLGPVIVPTVSGCWECWERRLLQHDQHPTVSSSISTFYNEDTPPSPLGYIGALAQLVASQIVNLTNSSETLAAWAGIAWQLNMFSLEVIVGRLVGVDGCLNCGLRRPAQVRSVAELKEFLSGISKKP